MREIKLAIDLGASDVKCVYSVSDTKIESKNVKKSYFLFESYCEEISSLRIEQYYDLKGSIGVRRIEDNLYIQIDKQYIVLGSLASELTSDVQELRKPKYEVAAYKVLAAIGIVLTKHCLNAKSVSLNLGVFLPWNEYGDKSLFADRLKKLASNFSFGKELKLSFKIGEIIVRVEGSGVIEAYTSKYKLKDSGLSKIGVLMIGHRNISGLYFEKEKFIKGDSPLLGFGVLCDRACEISSKSNTDEICSVIIKILSNPKNFYSFSKYGEKTEKVIKKKQNPAYSYMRDIIEYEEIIKTPIWKLEKNYPKWEEMPEIINIININDEEFKKAEIKKISDSIRQATEEYQDKFIKWCSKFFPKDLECLLICGGGQKFFEPFLSQQFNQKELVCKSVAPSPNEANKIYFETDKNSKILIINKRSKEYNIYKDMIEEFKFNNNDDLTDRLLDVYYLYNRL